MPRLVGSALLALLAGCTSGPQRSWTAEFGDPGSQWTGPDGVYRGPTLVDRIWLDCAPDEPAWHYTITTYGWASEVTLVVHRWYPDALEQHRLALSERGDDGQWERRDAVLPVVAEGLGVPDLSTEMDCDWSFDTWRIGTQDLDGVESDCVVFGYDTDRLDGAGRCREFVLASG